MTSFDRAAAAAVFAVSIAAGPAFGQSGMSPAMEEMLEVVKLRNDVTGSVIAAYESTEVVETTSPADKLPPSTVQGLRSGEPIPEDVALEPVPDVLEGKLPAVEGAEWRRAGDHLVAVRDGTAELIVWEVLP